MQPGGWNERGLKTSWRSWRYQGRLDISPTSDPLYANGARLYSPSLGTFTSLDTTAGKATNPLSMNRFLYAEANPATFIDPSGHCVYNTSTHGLDGSDCGANAHWNADDKPRANSSNCHPSNQNEANNCSSYGTTTNPHEVSNWEFHKNQYKLDHPDKPKAQQGCGLDLGCNARAIGKGIGDVGRGIKDGAVNFGRGLLDAGACAWDPSCAKGVVQGLLAKADQCKQDFGECLRGAGSQIYEGGKGLVDRVGHDISTGDWYDLAEGGTEITLSILTAKGLGKAAKALGHFEDAGMDPPAIKPGSAGGPTAGDPFPNSVKAATLDGNPDTCVYCRMTTGAPQVDHSIPKALGGNATIDNAQTTCPWCNASKGARPFPVNPPPGYQGAWPPYWWGGE